MFKEIPVTGKRLKEIIEKEYSLHNSLLFSATYRGGLADLRAIFYKIMIDEYGSLANYKVLEFMGKHSTSGYSFRATFNRYIVYSDFKAKYDRIKDLFNDKQARENSVRVVFKKPNGMIETWSFDNKIMKDLSGKYTRKLHNKIKNISNDRTLWNGFE